MRKLLFTIVALCLAAGPGWSAKRPTSKAKTSSTRRATAKKSKSSRRARSRKATSARQQAPTTDRYKEIQQALADKGHYQGDIDGRWDAECVAALKRFQQEQNLNPDGKLGALSIIALGLGPKYESSALAKPEPAAESEQ